MNIYIYSDESGVFDKEHNDIFTFGGILFLGREAKESATRKYKKAEKDIRRSRKYSANTELKASIITNKEKYSLYRSLNKYFKFGVIIEQKKVYDNIFNHKKDKQRFLDYAYKIAVRRFLEYLISQHIIDKNENINIYFYIDEHTTATNGRYELKEGLEQELKRGTYNYSYTCHYPSVFNNLDTIELSFCNSASKTLIRAADIIANNLYYKAIHKDDSIYSKSSKLYVIKLP